MQRELQYQSLNGANNNLKMLKRSSTYQSMAATVKAIMTAIMPKDQFSSDRQIDRKEVYKRLFNGDNLSHEEMFRSRGFRGLNILPFPESVK